MGELKPSSCSFTDCSLDVATSALPSGIVCHIPSTCTTVQCCVDATTPLGLSFTTVLDLDPCTHQLTLGIENFVLKISLYDFEFGMLNYFLNHVLLHNLAICTLIAITDTYLAKALSQNNENVILFFYCSIRAVLLLEQCGQDEVS